MMVGSLEPLAFIPSPPPRRFLPAVLTERVLASFMLLCCLESLHGAGGTMRAKQREMGENARRGLSSSPVCKSLGH